MPMPKRITWLGRIVEFPKSKNPRKHCVICGRFSKHEFFCKRCQTDRTKRKEVLKYIETLEKIYGKDNASLRIKLKEEY